MKRENSLAMSQIRFYQHSRDLISRYWKLVNSDSHMILKLTISILWMKIEWKQRYSCWTCHAFQMARQACHWASKGEETTSCARSWHQGGDNYSKVHWWSNILLSGLGSVPANFDNILQYQFQATLHDILAIAFSAALRHGQLSIFGAK